MVNAIFVTSTLLICCVFSGAGYALTCDSALSDTDGDGWGWENNASCLVAGKTNAQAANSRARGSFTDTDCPDPDGDGWGWVNGQSCAAVAPATTENHGTDSRTQQVEACPDPDGDGWGWANGRSCRVSVVSNNDATTTANTEANAFNDSTNNAGSDFSINQPADKRPYPQRDPFLIKAIQTDHWQNRSDFTQANTGGVVVNLVWSNWQPVQERAPCNANHAEYQGFCYQINPVFDEQIRHWSNQGLNVTGVMWGVPAWARGDDCYSDLPGREIFCSSQDPQSFGRFAGMLAKRYNGRNGHGRLNDFVVHNEVNMNDWYDHDCGQGTRCNTEEWLDNYASNFNAAYDQITAELPDAKVFVPLAHQFAESFDTPAAVRPVISVKTFVRGVNARTSGRTWRVAYHPYNKSLGVANFNTDDLPHVTFGNIGILAGWLRNEFPQQPLSWEIYLTESGFNSISPVASESAQAAALCNSFRNALATPGIENYIYHRMQDHPAEVSAGVGLGLRHDGGGAKQAWHVWANVSGRNGNHNNLDCGFEHLPYTQVNAYTHPTRKPRASSRIASHKYQLEQSWYLQRNYVQNANMVFECQQDDGSYLSTDNYCENNLSLGPVGYAYRQPSENRAPLFSCEKNGVRYLSDETDCGADTLVEFLGFARTNK